MSLRLPKDGFAGLRAHWFTDATSGFLVFLIALPLCLGIAMASGFPPFAGLITAMVGGLLVSPIMGSRLSIKGPAAGLISIAAAAVLDLGNGNVAQGYPLVLAVVVAVGLVQAVFGLLKLGKWGDLFPTSAVHGMLAAIGIIIISKQLPVLLGIKPVATKPLELLAEFPQWLDQLIPSVALIGGISLGVLILWNYLPKAFSKKMPAALVVLLVSIGAAHFLKIESTSRVALPDSFLGGFSFPDFSQIFSSKSLEYIVMFALVGSLESLLTVKAVDGLDPYHRKSDANKDLVAVGLGNSLSGLMGGLPMIAEVVRSSANVNNGAQTRWSNFFHGSFLLLFVALIPNFLELIPLSALAALLLFTGFRLASPSLFALTAKIGWDQLLVFGTTVILTLVEDLLVGIFVGTALELLLQLIHGVRWNELFTLHVEKDFFEDTIHVHISGNLGFGNLVKLNRLVHDLPSGRPISVHLDKSVFIDHTSMEYLHHLKHSIERNQGQLTFDGLNQFKGISKHELSSRKKAKRATV
jgi:MFS superfamily sulfate permease-like transporter